MTTMAEMAARENAAVTASWSVGSARIHRACEALGLFVSEAERMQMAEIVDEVSAVSGVSVSDIMGRSRQGKVAKARQVAMWECHGAKISYVQIGQFFDRDHTTVMHAVSAVREVMGAGQ